MKPLAMYALVVLGSLAGVRPAACQKPVYAVHGVVKDTEGSPIPGVEILLQASEHKTLTDRAGRFTLDGMPAGRLRLLVRRIGYFPMQPPLTVPQAPGDTLTILMLQVPQPLPMVEVQSDHAGIRGTVGDTGFHALRGTRVELLGASLETTADSLGRFAFEGLKPRQYLLRLSRPGYQSRLITVDLGRQGLEYAIFLKEARLDGFDWATSHQAGPPLFDLGRRLAWEPAKNRMTRAELIRYGTLALCDIPRVPKGRGDVGLVIILRGQSVFRDADACAWSADQIELLEWGDDPCREAWKTVAELLGTYCGPRRTQSFGHSAPPPRPPPYVILWLRN